ncbi:MAG: hypothetical protein H6722_13975 [Sandaracinus sp.]|nr:hypothetical protein [Sandaracinus sp.]MCB9613551.1 hypothetical protein [Sandaracinus sp.]
MQNIDEMTLAEILDAGARGEIAAGPGLLASPAVTGEEAQRELVRALFDEPRFHPVNATFAKNARKVVVHVVVGRRDPVVMAMLERIADDAAHPLHVEALEELLATRDQGIIAPLYTRFVPKVLDEHPFNGYTHRLALGATFVMGTDAVTRELVPRYLTEAAITRDASGLSRASAVIFELVHQIGAKKVASNDPGLIEATLALESCKPIKKPWTKLLAALDASAVAKVRAGSGGPAPTAPAPPAPKVKKKAASSKAASSKAASSKAASSKAASSKAASSRAASSKAASASATAGGVAGGGHLARYEAGEHRAVWAELRALGDKVQEAPLDAEARAIAAATMKAFVASVDVIAAVLKKAKYTLAEKKAVRPPRRDVAKQLGALAKIVGPLPIALVAFYEACDGVTLAQDVDAPVDDSPLFGPGVLDELGRNDPLIVAPLSVVLEDAKEQQARASGPVRLYVAPDPACKGTIDDEIPDENPVRTHATPAMDAELVGGGSGWFVEWLRSYVEAGGFLGSLADEDRAELKAKLRPF